MECDIVIRAARPEDKQARAELIEQSISSYDKDAIIFFILQELLLQMSVLSGAVLFIFVGVGLHAVALAPLVLALLTALGVLAAHRAVALSQRHRMRQEEAGFVAEYRGPLGVPRAQLRPRFVREAPGAAGPAPGAVGPAPGAVGPAPGAVGPAPGAAGPAAGAAVPVAGARHSRVVGTLSLAEFRGARRSAWLFGFAVEPQWQRCGVGSALLSAARAHAQAERLESLELALSCMQHRPRSLLHSHGWELRGTYHRRLLGDTLTLPMLQMGLELPPA